MMLVSGDGTHQHMWLFVFFVIQKEKPARIILLTHSGNVQHLCLDILEEMVMFHIPMAAGSA